MQHYANISYLLVYYDFPEVIKTEKHAVRFNTISTEAQQFLIFSNNSMVYLLY